MVVTGRVIVFVLSVLVVVIVGGVLLQTFLSRRESRWPGLVLPLLTFLQSLLLLLNLTDAGSVSKNVLLAVTTLLVGNIPTLVLLAIYWAAREKRRVKAQLDRMNISDL